MEQTLPSTCKVSFSDPHRLFDFNLLIIPDEGYWCGGRFYFHIFIPEEYNMIVCFFIIFSTGVIIQLKTLSFLSNATLKLQLKKN